jgi:hypothetical protein
MSGIAVDDDKAFLVEVEKWREILRDTANIALEQDGVPDSKVKIVEDERASLQWAARTLYAIDELLKVFKALPYQHERAHALSCLCSVIGASFAIGSHASVSETQRVFQHKTAQSKGGKASGEARGPRPWHDAARELAIRTRAKNPRITRTGISEIISTRVAGAPSPRQVRPFLAALEKAGALPLKTR